MDRLIDTIELPQGLRELSAEELKQAADELRDELISTMSSSSGHLASSLGAAEVTVALHASFNMPNDRIIWDVGHQGYIHKMVTGRRSQMNTIRQKGGISGFLSRKESEYDAFGAGHAGTSVSAALGMAVALEKQNPHRRAIAVIGDGSITAGMALEALNHAGALGTRIIVVLNDNEMSISPNVGALSWLFSKTVTSSYSTRARSGFKALHKKGYVPHFVYRAIDKAEEAAQSFFATPSMLFEAFGFRYIGPVDGHNISELLIAFERAKDQDVPVLVHAQTVKGKGYEPAEEDPITWHAVKPFDRVNGRFIGSAVKRSKKPKSYTRVFAESLIKIADSDPRIAAVTAAMATGTGLDRFEKVHPDSFYDVAICEQHAVTFAAGLACEGYKPFCAIYSTFLQRAFDQIVHDVCIQKLPVAFAIDRAGVVGNDGETHQGVFDIAYLRCIPEMTLMSPKDENELQHMLYTASRFNAPIAVRYPRGLGQGVELDREFKELQIGKGEILSRGQDCLLIGFGPVVAVLCEAARQLEEETGLTSTVINARFAKPLDEDLLRKELPDYPVICTIEDHALMGGFGSAVVEFASDSGIALQSPVKRFGIMDSFVGHASQAEQHEANEMDLKSVLSYLRKQAGSVKKAANL